jgi:Zn-dependent metalloprotease
MSVNPHFPLSVFILTIVGLVVNSCGAHSKTPFSPDVIIRYGENATPIYIKGDNLSADLDDDPHFQDLRQKRLYGDMAYAFIESRPELFKLDDPRAELEVTQEKVDNLQYKHVRLQQVIDSIPVWGREITIHLNAENQIYLFQGHYEPSFKKVRTTPRISEKAAAELAASAATSGGKTWRATEKELWILITDPRTPRLAYRITVVRGLGQKEHYFVDAVDGRILHKISGIQD